MVSIDLNLIIDPAIKNYEVEFNKEIENEFNILNDNLLSDSEKLDLLKKSRASQLKLFSVVSLTASNTLTAKLINEQ